MRNVLVPLTIPAVDGEDFIDAAPNGTLCDVDHNVDGACDARLLRRDGDAADEVFQSEECIGRAVTVYGGAAASVSR